MIRRPPRSTLFPTTLFRSHLHALAGAFGEQPHDAPAGVVTAEDEGRSEEHTSELQSLAYLVCRLLLGKKKIFAHAVGLGRKLCPHRWPGEPRALQHGRSAV